MKKTPNPDPKRDPTSKDPPSTIQGEGDYVAARRYRKDVEEFVEETGPDSIREKAEDAERAIEGAEGEDLRRAEAKGQARARR